MKKIILTNVLLLVAIASVLADANYTTRKNCWGALSWRYKTYANIWEPVHHLNYFADGSGSSNSCSSTFTTKYGYYVPILPGVTGAIAKASTGIYGNQAYVNIYSGFNGFFNGGANTDMQIADLSFSPMYENDDIQLEKLKGSFANISSNIINFNENSHSVEIKGLNGILGIDEIDMANGYATFKIWILDATNESDESNAKILKTIQAFILNGKLVLEGDFKQSDFIQENDKAIYNLANVDKIIPIDKSVSLENILVKIGSDVGNLGQGINEDYRINFNSNKYAKNTNEIIENSMLKLNILGNPTTDNLKFNLSNGTKEYANSIISIFGNDGKLIRQVYSGELTNSIKEFNIEISSLPIGNYYLTVQTNTNEKFTRKFIKQ